VDVDGAFIFQKADDEGDAERLQYTQTYVDMAYH